MVKRALILSLCLALLSVLSCSPANQVKNFPTLANRGILPLSTTNPFVGANLFLASECEKSSFLFNFFKGRGAPVAIEIIEDTFRPVRLVMFYPADKEVYAADLQADKRNRQWIIRGPFQIERNDYRELSRLEASLQGEPVFQIYGKPYRFRFHRESSRPTRLEPVVPPTPVPTPKKRKKVVPKVKTTPTPNPIDFRPMNSDQLAIYMSQGFAERTKTGDLIHSVNHEAESIEAVAKWYTGSADNAARLKITNGITSDGPLVKGTQIRVPLGLIKNPKQMPIGYK